jgi:hypothetical protein
MNESWADKQVEQKNAQIELDATREALFEVVQGAIRNGISLEAFLPAQQGFTERYMRENGSTPEQISAGLFIMECWVREAYERHEKEQKGIGG